MLNYKSSGNGKTIVFLHGFCEDLTLWDSYFSNSGFVDYRLLSIDLPGHGKSGIFNHFSTIAEMADMVIKTLDKLGVLEFGLVGHSLGGYVSLEIAKKLKERVLGILFFHSSIFSDSEEKKLNRDKVVEFVKINGVTPFVSTLVPSLFDPNNISGLSKEISKLLSIAQETDKLGLINTTIAMRNRESFKEFVKSLKIPVFYIVGKNDKAVTFEQSIEQIQIPQKSYSLVLDNVAHMGMYEAEKDSISFIEYFFKTI
ncbi:MAG: alpha/beta hydrolase [Cytophagales bacterium]